MSAKLHALLVGIDTYPAPLRPLSGCVNDVHAMQRFLEERVTPSQIKVLLNRDASRMNIIQSFRMHLSQAQAGDTALFYYCGHGSQEFTPPLYHTQEPDGLDETLVAYDSRQPASWDIADKELAVLIAEVASKEVHVLIILDSCHSGTATRLASTVTPRQLDSDTRIRPVESFWFFNQEHTLPATLNSAGGWRILPEGSHILLSACRDSQSALEITTLERERRGLFSYHLLETLKQLGDQVNYRAIHKQVQTLVSNRMPLQIPQAEGDLEQRFLDGVKLFTHATYHIRSFLGRGWRLDAGTIHGIQKDSEFAVLPASAKDYSALRTKVASVRVTKVDATESAVEVIEGCLPKPFAALPAVITHLPLPPLHIAFNDTIAPFPALKTSILASPYLTLEDDLAVADLLVLVESGRCHLQHPTTITNITAPIYIMQDDPAEIVRALEHIARWQVAANLSNPGSPLVNVMRMTIYEWLGPPATAGTEPQAVSLEAEPEIRLRYSIKQGMLQPKRFTVKLSNTSTKPLFFALLALAENFSIKVINKASGQLKEGHTLWIREQDGISAIVPISLHKEGMTQRRDVLLLLFSELEADFSLLEQPALGESFRLPGATRRAAFRDVLSALLRRADVRELDDDDVPLIANQWAVQKQIIITERPQI